MKKLALIPLTILSLLLLAMIPSVPDEGMFPLSEISNLDLNSAGLKISVDEVYNPNGVSLVDALVKIGGCTGSFVSPEGLIITNHHCSFGAVQKVSTTINNYLENGFLAETREEEIPAEGFTCRITISYKDVSAEILEAANQADDITERTKAIRKEIKKIVKKEEEKDSTIKAEVSEMFVGQSYVLFRYKTIKDVRLVYVPPLSIGDFGGESDNWIWPRHTGDFSFLRAYVAPNGSSADYSEENVPFTPKKYLEVNPNGVNEEDFVFLLGYPGRTFKHQPSQLLKFQMEYQLPYISKLYRWMIDLFEEKGEDDPEFALKISSRIKSLANVEKNYKGKMRGFKRLDLREKKKEEENRLQDYIEADLELKEKYGNVLMEIDEVYNEIHSEGRLRLVLIMINRYSTLYRLAFLLLDYHNELTKPEDERLSLYTEKRRKDLLKQIDNMFKDYNPELDKKILKKIIGDARTFPETQSFSQFSKYENAEELNEQIDEIYDDTELMDIEEYKALLFGSTEDVNDLDDHAILFAKEFYELNDEIENKRDARSGKLNILLAQFMEVKKLFLDKSFIPDANRTLRLTYGYIRGYEPADAIYYSPISTLKGVIEKGEEKGDYKLLPVIRKLYEKKDFGKFEDEKLGDVPVAILYNTDTSGGNSGSPIMDAYGRLVGVNFDRPIEATINDFVWSEEYSRSIGVDIRYILWITQKVGHADFLLDEMGINLN
ncbi:MAG: S46 family peptidase [Ignavibacteriaceae bacterium]